MHYLKSYFTLLYVLIFWENKTSAYHIEAKSRIKFSEKAVSHNKKNTNIPPED